MARINEAPARRRPRSGTRSGHINIRVDPSIREIIDLAADTLGKDRTSFMIDAAHREAERVLMDRRFFFLDAAAWDQLMEALDAPPKDNPRLRKLMARRPIWER